MIKPAISRAINWCCSSNSLNSYRTLVFKVLFKSFPRFQYPENPWIWQSNCAFLISLVLGPGTWSRTVWVQQEEAVRFKARTWSSVPERVRLQGLGAHGAELIIAHFPSLWVNCERALIRHRFTYCPAQHYALGFFPNIYRNWRYSKLWLILNTNTAWATLRADK